MNAKKFETRKEAREEARKMTSWETSVMKMTGETKDYYVIACWDSKKTRKTAEPKFYQEDGYVN